MKICAIMNIWADTSCIYPYMIENIRPVVDGIIVVWSVKSNRGQIIPYVLPKDCILVQCEPGYSSPHSNELARRNAGLEAAKKEGFTHFIMMDGDEGYIQSEFLQQKQIIKETGLIGSVCRVKTYFKSPKLTIGMDRTFVPFIHKITPRLKYILSFKQYPFAFDAGGASQIDCTRRLNITTGVKLMDITMQHFAYVRKDMSLKLQNSSASFKAHRSAVVYEDLKNAKPGYFLKGYQKTLIECENTFNLPIYE